VFCLTIALVAPALGVVIAVPLALGACLAVSAAWLASNSPRR
jgi:ABC-type phosphate/phosphonate transport system permease subunit